MKFIKVIKAKENKKYVIFENIVSENISGYWSEQGELTDLQNAGVFESLDEAKFQVNAQIKHLEHNNENVEHYFAVREVVLETLTPAIYEAKFNEIK